MKYGGALAGPLPGPQAPDPLLGGRVVREQVLERHVHPRQRAHDVQGRHLAVHAGHRDLLGAEPPAWPGPGPAARRRRSAGRRSGRPRTPGCGTAPAAADVAASGARMSRASDLEDVRAPVVAPTAEEQATPCGDPGQQGDGHGDRGGHRGDEDVPVADVARSRGPARRAARPRCRSARIPWVTATAAWSGLRPVAKALGCASGVTYSFGMGMPARVVRSRTTGSSPASAPRTPGAPGPP